MVDIWQVGNTGVRNPLRIQAGLKVYAESNLIGQIRGVHGAVSFMKLLCEKGILNNESGKDVTGSYGRKWRLVFNLNGFTYPDVEQEYGFSQKELGSVDKITPFGDTFLQADTLSAIQECFLRAMSVKMTQIKDDAYFSPLCWTLAVLLKIEEKTGNSDVSFLEFAVCIQTTNPSFDITTVVSNILKIRQRKADCTAKKKFDRQIYEEISQDYARKSENFKEYGDMNLRYLRASGIFQRKGRGIAIVPEKRALAIQLATNLISKVPLLERYKALCSGPSLPTDDLALAKAVLDDLIKQLDTRHIKYDISGLSLDTAIAINNTRRNLEEKLSQFNELRYAENQRKQWKEIYDYMELIMKRGGTKHYDDDTEIVVPKEEAAAYFEWVIWRAFLAIDHLTNKAYEVRRFSVDQDFYPVNTAPGNGPDLIAEFDDCVVVVEVTLSENSRQEAMEGEPVRRHVADLIQRYDKPVYGLFIANRIDSNTAETFRIGVWYTQEDKRLELHIIPFTLAQFSTVFKSIFTTQNAAPQAIIHLMDECEQHRKNCESPEWKKIIAKIIQTKTTTNGQQNNGIKNEPLSMTFTLD